MGKQETGFVAVIALDDFRARGQLIKKDERFTCTPNTAKSLVGTKQARYPEPEPDEQVAEDDAADDSKDKAPAKGKAAGKATE